MKLSLRLAPLLAVLAFAGCGGTSHSTTASAGPQQTIAGHACDPANYVMQCALQTLPPPPANSRAGVPFSAQGVDFAWSCPVIAGKQFGASYFSPDTSKNWTAACVTRYHQAGQATVGVYESSANRAQQGFNAGFTDAFNGRIQARRVGEPDTRPLDYATDCDCSTSSILAYYQGADAGTASILHISHAAAVQLVGIYGGYYQVRGMFNAGAVGNRNWQTYAWSGGLWLPASIAPLEQYLNSNAVDYDRAIAADYGQWPAPAPPGPSPAQIKAWQTARNSNLAVYHKLGCKFSVLDAPYKCRLAGVYVLSAVRSLDAAHVQATPQCWGKQANLTAAACVIERPNVSAWSRARGASANALDRLGCNGPVSFPAPVHSKTCDPIRQRRNYFDGRVQAALKEF